jgi:hypothetical protein
MWASAVLLINSADSLPVLTSPTGGVSNCAYRAERLVAADDARHIIHSNAH